MTFYRLLLLFYLTRATQEELDPQISVLEHQYWNTEVARIRTMLDERTRQRNRRISNIRNQSRSEFPKKWDYLDHLVEIIANLKTSLAFAEESVRKASAEAGDGPAPVGG